MFPLKNDIKMVVKIWSIESSTTTVAQGQDYYQLKGDMQRAVNAMQTQGKIES